VTKFLVFTLLLNYSGFLDRCVSLGRMPSFLFYALLRHVCPKSDGWNGRIEGYRENPVGREVEGSLPRETEEAKEKRGGS
jgi:hypothetical protein